MKSNVLEVQYLKKTSKGEYVLTNERQDYELAILKFPTSIIFPLMGTKYCLGSELPEIEMGATLNLKHEPKNLFDKNAIAVYLGQQKLGYIPKAINKKIDPYYHKVSYLSGYSGVMRVRLQFTYPSM